MLTVRLYIHHAEKRQGRLFQSLGFSADRLGYMQTMKPGVT